MSVAGGRKVLVLNVAEKPSVAKAVAGILSRNQGLRVRDGRSRFNRIFEFDYTIGRQQCHMLFTSVTGHLMELDFDDRYKKWHSCDPADLYSAPVRKHVAQDKLDIKRTLEEEARKCQWLVLWLDCDREGENIAFEVIEVCTDANRHLNIWRAHFSALIDREIHEAAQHLARPNQFYSDAVDARQEIDLRIGASFTRFQTMLLKDAYILDFSREDQNVVLSYGPCQFPTLGFVVERFWEIQAHEPEEFWTINCSHTSSEGTVTFSWMRGHLFDYTCAVIIYEMCMEEPTATVTRVRNQERFKHPPHPLSTVELQKRASRYFRMSSEHTMKVAEDLYQAGFISYPRTETDCFSVNTDLHAIVEGQQGHPLWGSYAQRLLDPEAGIWRNPSNGGHDDKAHPPIHPTKFSTGESGWSPDHNKLYELVVRHFLACVSKPAVGAETTIEIDIAGELFSASGRVIISKNYLEVYRFESWGGCVIPKYNLQQQFVPTTLTLDSGVTRPPPLLSESDLLSCMDKAGIGTDATMHDHIKKLLDRCYATKDSNTRFSPTNLGEALVMGYDIMGYELWKPYLRSMMECDMKAVSVGTKRKAEVLDTCLRQMKACFLDAKMNKNKLLEAMDVFFERSNRFSVNDPNAMGEIVCHCHMCQESDMVLRKKPDGKFMVGCRQFPNCRNVIWLPGSISEASVTNQVCNSCSPGPMFKIHFKFRRMEIPPNYNVDHLGCIGGCDETLIELTEICGTGPRSIHNASARARASHSIPSSLRSRQRGSGSMREDMCIRCKQVGHSSELCPLHASTSTPSGNPRFQNEGGSIICNSCGATCVIRTATTANNRGRKFYSCQSPDCNFFVWEDNFNNNSIGRVDTPQSNKTRSTSSSSNATRRGNRGKVRREAQAGIRGHTTSSNFLRASTFVTATGEPISGNRCFICGDPGHFANVCPNRGM